MPKPNVHNIILSFFIFLLSFFINSCSEDPPVFPQNHNITMTIDPEVLESWIELHVDGLKKDAIYTVQRGTLVIFEGKLDKADTLLHDENLEPATTYTYSAYARQNGEKSEIATTTAITMDTTSHDFSVTKYYFEPGNFNDCLIWDKNNFWITGDYKKRDSSDNLVGPYTILSYENENWVDIEIKDKSNWSNPIPLSNVRSFWAASRREVWLAVYDIYKWTGGLAIPIWDGDIAHIQGYSKNEIYAGGNGILLKIDDSAVNNISVPESYNIRDIWINKNQNVIVPVSDVVSNEQKLLFIENGQIIREKTLNYTDFAGTIWFNNKLKIFIGGNSVSTIKNNILTKTYHFENITFITKIRGTEINNVFAITSDGKVFHFNGISWKKITNVPAILKGLAVINNLVVIAGKSSIGSYVVKIEY